MTIGESDEPRWLMEAVDLDKPPSRVEALLQRQVLKLTRTLESRTRGLYAEVLIAEILGDGAELGNHVMSPWDVRWTVGGRAIDIAVRTTGTVNSYSYEERDVANGWSFSEGGAYFDHAPRLTDEKKRCWADVAVLAHHQGTDINDGWTFYVVPASKLNRQSDDEHPRKSISVAAARTLAKKCVGPHGLADAIVEAIGS
jgi:hypothetical protein